MPYTYKTVTTGITSKTPAGRHATEGCLAAFFAGGLLGLALGVALGVALPRRIPLRAVFLVRRDRCVTERDTGAFVGWAM